MGSLLLVGTATDGSNYLTRWIDSPSQVLKNFGKTYVQREVITPTQTTLTLAYNTNNCPIDFINNKSSQLYLINQTTSNTVAFGRIGGTTNTTVDFTYQPYLGNTDLCWMIEKYQEYTSGGYAVRLAGAVAELTTGTWKFVAKHPGSKYNKVNINITTNTVTVSGMSPEYTTKTYTGIGSDIVDQIKYDLSLGISPVDVETFTAAFPTSNSTLTGGSDGTLTEENFYAGMQIADIPIDVSHVYVPLLLTQRLVEVCNELQNILGRPIIWLVPTVTSSPISTWITDKLEEVPLGLDSMLVIPGTVQTKLANTVTRYAAEEVAMALGSASFNLTNTKIPVTNFEPKYSKADLDALTDAGFTCLTRRMYNDICIYQGTTSTKFTSFYKQFITSIGISRISNFLNQFIGTAQDQGPNQVMQDGVLSVLENIEFLTITSVSVEVVASTIYVDVQGELPNEILTISFIVKS